MLFRIEVPNDSHIYDILFFTARVRVGAVDFYAPRTYGLAAITSMQTHFLEEHLFIVYEHRWRDTAPITKRGTNACVVYY